MASPRAARSRRGRSFGWRVGWACLLFAFVLAVSLQIGHWSSLPLHEREEASKPQPPRPEMYTGSILFTQVVGDKCWQRALDNRTNKIIDIGEVPCDGLGDAASRSQSPRLDAIRKSFRGN